MAVYKKDTGCMLEDAVCTFCGYEHPTGFWHGSYGDVYCCEDCGTDTLPLLAADSIDGNGCETGCRALSRITGMFWKGFIAKISRTINLTEV